MTTIRWGIVGTGWVSHAFGTDLLKYMPHNKSDIKHVITAVGSSSVSKAKTLITQDFDPIIKSLDSQNVEISALSYDDLYSCKDVDIIYVGSPHVNHLENCLLAIKAGKHVLCEKPVTVNAKQLRKILDAAKANNVFFMEALWVRFFPANRKLVDLIYGPQKILGEVKYVATDYSFSVDSKTNINENHRLVKKSLGGGALLDIGVYPLTYLRMYLNPALDPLTDWKLARSKVILRSYSGKESELVDYLSTATFDLPKFEQKGTLEAGFFQYSKVEDFCVIEGTRGTARLKHAGFPGVWEYKLTIDGKETVETFENPVKDTLGFYFQAIAVGEALAAGKKEHPIAPWADSWAEMTLIDKIRSDNGFFYDEDHQD